MRTDTIDPLHVTSNSQKAPSLFCVRDLSVLGSVSRYARGLMMVGRQRTNARMRHATISPHAVYIQKGAMFPHFASLFCIINQH